MSSRSALRVTLAAIVLVLSAGPSAAAIRYGVSLDHPERHLFHVTMTVPVQGRQLVVALPAWNALYQIRDFAFHLGDVTAVCSALTAVPLHIVQLDKQTWRVELSGACQPGDHNNFEIRYPIQWDDPGPFSSQLNAQHAFMNLAEILMYIPDRRSEDAELDLQNIPPDWKSIAELPAGAAPASYVAHSYDALVDAPVEAGTFDEFEFDSGGAHFRVVVDAASWKRNLLESALRRITAYQLQLMGGAPFNEYTFFFHIGPELEMGGGGMEHANSTAIAATSLEGAVSIAAHEFFHAWNVKRIRPQALEPVDYSREQYTRALWFAEGVTNTYHAYTLERTGLWSKSQFYMDLAEQIERLESRPAREWQSVEESSLDAWFEKYPEYNSPDRSISYYDKGQIIGVLLDLEIRDATDNHKSLDDVLRRLNDEYAKQGKFYDESQGIRGVVEEVAGKSFDDFFRRFVAGADPIPYNEILSIGGLELKSGVEVSVAEIGHSTDRQRRIREGLLRGSTD